MVTNGADMVLIALSIIIVVVFTIFVDGTLGQFVLDNLRSAPRGEVRVRISFELDEDGIVHVVAEDIETGSAKDIRIEASSGLTDEEVQTMRFDQLGF